MWYTPNEKIKHNQSHFKQCIYLQNQASWAITKEYQVSLSSVLQITKCTLLVEQNLDYIIEKAVLYILSSYFYSIIISI